jgi:hypothetical protein
MLLSRRKHRNPLLLAFEHPSDTSVATSKALADGRDMSEIGLMRDIAQRTVAVLADDARI